MVLLPLIYGLADEWLLIQYSTGPGGWVVGCLLFKQRTLLSGHQACIVLLVAACGQSIPSSSLSWVVQQQTRSILGLFCGHLGLIERIINLSIGCQFVLGDLCSILIFHSGFSCH